jgi:hypothetical protein
MLGTAMCQGFAPLKVMRTYPDPLFASNAAGRRSSRFGALSQVVSASRDFSATPGSNLLQE